MSTKKTNPANPYTVLPMEQLVPSPLYPFARAQDDDREDLNRLRSSIRQNGILQPLMVRPMPDGRYEIICGHRRRTVCRKIGLSELPCLVQDMSDADAVARMVVDNERYRKQIRPSEMARAVAKMMALYTHQGVAGDQPGQRSNQLVADKLGADAEAITEKTSFKEDLGADSLDLFELVMGLEDEFGIEIPTDDLEQITTVGDVINYINEHK